MSGMGSTYGLAIRDRYLTIGIVCRKVKGRKPPGRLYIQHNVVQEMEEVCFDENGK